MTKVFYIGAREEVEHHARPLQRELEVTIAPPEQALVEAAPGDVCIFFNEYYEQFRSACMQLRQRNCATLYAIDGILEWRNSWEFPEGISCQWTMRPVLSHKVACIGRSQARVLESWGALGKCEVVGVPRLDALGASATGAARRVEDRFTVLVMTAKNPGFTPEQVERAEQSLRDLKDWFDRRPTVAGQAVQPLWRVTGDLAQRLGVVNQLRDTTGGDLASALQTASAVITTASTAMLEGMLCGLPVALLDYHNTPRYVPAAWTIAAPQHIAPTLEELVTPPPAKLLWQDTILHDALECRSPATPRLAALVREMGRIGRERLQAGRPLEFPRRILADEQDGHHLPEPRFDPRALYPHHPTFAEPADAAWQAEAANLRAIVARQNQKLAQLQARPGWRRRAGELLRSVTGAGAAAVRSLSGLGRRTPRAPTSPERLSS